MGLNKLYISGFSASNRSEVRIERSVIPPINNTPVNTAMGFDLNVAEIKETLSNTAAVIIAMIVLVPILPTNDVITPLYIVLLCLGNVEVKLSKNYLNHIYDRVIIQDIVSYSASYSNSSCFTPEPGACIKYTI